MDARTQVIKVLHRVPAHQTFVSIIAQVVSVAAQQEVCIIGDVITTASERVLLKRIDKLSQRPHNLAELKH